MLIHVLVLVLVAALIWWLCIALLGLPTIFALIVIVLLALGAFGHFGGTRS